MALTARQLTQLHRRQQLTLREATARDMKGLWPALSWTDLDGTYPDLAAATAEMVAKHRRTSAGLAAAYLRTHRVASGLDGDVRIAIPQTLNVGQLNASLHATSVASAKAAAGRGVDPSRAMETALTRAAGAVARLVLDAGRETVLNTLKGDDEARGFRRVVGSGACAFCLEVGGSGSRVYNVDADFDVHDRCGCTSEPVYG